MIPKEPLHPIVAKIPVLATVGEAYMVLLREPVTLVLILALPLLLAEGLWYLCFYTIGGYYDGYV